MPGPRNSSIIIKPWGSEETWANTYYAMGRRLTIKPGHRLSRKYHRTKDLSVSVLEGTLIVEVGPLMKDAPVSQVSLSPGEGYFLEAGTIHRFSAGPDGAQILELSRQGAYDAVRLEDDYRRINSVPSRVPQSDK
tara:strand:+ start:7767 stop:8171 length:405 start_codon:yes stop_codon:yes gene_type:complete